MAVGALPDGTPVIVSGGWDDTVRVWRLADGTPVGEPLTGPSAGCTRWRSGRCRTAPRSSSAAADDGTVRVWRLADGTPVGEPLTGHTGTVDAVAVGALPDGTPVIVSGSGGRHGAGVAAGRRHPGRGAADRPHRRGARGGGGALPDGTPVIVSGGWRRHGAGMAAGRRHPARAIRWTYLNRYESIALHGNIIVTAAGPDIAVHQPVAPMTHTKLLRVQLPGYGDATVG